jgi:tight adherence protein B
MGVALGVLVGLAAFALAGTRRRAPGPSGVSTGGLRGAARSGLRGSARSGRLGAGRSGLRWPGRSRSGPPSMISVLAHVLELLRSGLPPDRAWREAAGLATISGAPGAGALHLMVAGLPTGVRAAEARAADAIIAATRLSAEVGAPLVDVLDRLRSTLEAEDELASERAAALAGPRASARILGWLPVAGLGLGAAMGADPISVFFDGGVGSAVMFACLGCHLAGRALSRRLVRLAERAGDAP